jgi:UDP-N-acetylglucosamine--N-acetylmuramyl-(pentapeptide) pyrophosphoryl-undecaprenol N-acetylglucosamine transferase
MNVVFTCGGTAGHVNPAIALAGLMKKKDPETKVLFVGSEKGMERELVKKAGYDFVGIEIQNFRRSMTPKNIAHNLATARMLMTAPSKAKKVIRDFRPDLVVGTGGYASYPMVKYGSKAGIPTAVHESNMVPGLTTKTLEPFADRVMVGFEACRQYYKNPEKVIVTGTPVRGDFFETTKDGARKKLGIADGLPVVVTFWGSLGASNMNAMMEDFVKRAARDKKFHHIYAVGGKGGSAMRAKLRAEGLDLSDCPLEDVRDYIYDMAEVMRAADMVICRAGASTISELTALGVPAIIVPSPYVVNNHQEKNARVLEKAGGAVILLEKETSGAELYDTALSLLSDKARLEKMGAAMASLGIPDATERIYETVTSIKKKA